VVRAGNKGAGLEPRFNVPAIPGEVPAPAFIGPGRARAQGPRCSAPLDRDAPRDHPARFGCI